MGAYILPEHVDAEAHDHHGRNVDTTRTGLDRLEDYEAYGSYYGREPWQKVIHGASDEGRDDDAKDTHEPEQANHEPFILMLASHRAFFILNLR